MGVGAAIRHGVERKRDVEAKLVSMTRGGLDAGAGGDAGDHHLDDIKPLEMLLEIGVGEGTPGALGYQVVCRLSSGTSSVQSGGNSPSARDCSERPGAPPSTLIRTTGRSWRRNASANLAALVTTSAIGCAVGTPTMPFCKSTTSSAVFVSSLLMVTCSLSMVENQAPAGGHHRWLQVSTQPIEKFSPRRRAAAVAAASVRVDGANEPILPRRPAVLDLLPAGRCQRQDGLPSIRRIRRPFDHPAASSTATVAPMDCERTASARASALTVVGPSRSRCISTAVCEGVRSPAEACSRRRRLSFPLRRMQFRREHGNAHRSGIGLSFAHAGSLADVKLNYKGKLCISPRSFAGTSNQPARAGTRCASRQKIIRLRRMRN